MLWLLPAAGPPREGVTRREGEYLEVKKEAWAQSTWVVYGALMPERVGH